MPIHLPPLSRRDFLKRSLATAAGLALTPRLFAAGARQLDQNSFALLADTHLAGDVTVTSRNVNMADHFRSVSGELLRLEKTPSHVFIAGDLALSKGEPEDYTTLVRLLDPIRGGGMTAHLALGNHDERQHFWDARGPVQTSSRSPAGKHVALIESPHANWFLLDSLEVTLQTPGLLGPEQLDWLKTTLDAHDSKPAIILVHHNPGTDGGITGLKDTEALFEVLRPRQQVKAWIYGHTHNWRVWQDESGIHLINLPPVAYVFKEGNPSGWVHATLTRDGMNLELRCVDSSHGQQGEKRELKWRS